ncbi:hypothetical protein G9A89_006180 [Geosiphon pyriformis]|nr:hypothetical protein G9A89_006180 [Geosiphon pyriformis]
MSSRSRFKSSPPHNSSSGLKSSTTHFPFKILPHFTIIVSQIYLSTIALFYLPSKKLLEDPVKALNSTVIILALIQLLVEAARWTLLLDGGRRFDGASSEENKRQGHFMIAIGLTLFGSFMIYIIAVLFGAPLLDKIQNTLLFSIYVSLLAIFPAACALRNNGPAWARIFSDRSPETIPEKLIYYPTVGTVVGAWLGATVIPLDWDRPWQVWPVSCVVGAFLGHAIGSLIALIACYFNEESAAQKKRIN